MVDNSLLVTAGWQNNVLNSHTFLKYIGTFFHDGNQLLLFDQEKLKLCSPKVVSFPSCDDWKNPSKYFPTKVLQIEENKYSECK